MFDYVLWTMVVVMALLLVVTMTMIACVKVKRSRTRGEFSFHHLRKNDSGEVRPRLINARDIHADLRRIYYLSPTIELGSQTSTSPLSFRTFHHDARETGSGVDSIHTGPSDGYRRYSLQDDGCLSLYVSSDGNSSSQHYDIPPPPRNQTTSCATDIHTVLRYAVPIHDDTDSASSSQTHYGDVSQTIVGAAVGNSEA
ncbi:hypothetical protein KP79_PYT16950 [Mizuhopecten yessoensis]|uniref:Uncharacterized protein n=1 Tax=Mizuhopecten yessoensis TaxID=6573 RepID=A0A210QKP9_MIZYE|nr:hypothetical protein KP79_PYT16950 [Mizuhopecten yessoensis]